MHSYLFGACPFTLRKVAEWRIPGQFAHAVRDWRKSHGPPAARRHPDPSNRQPLYRSTAMNAITLPSAARRPSLTNAAAAKPAARFDIGPVARTAISLACFTMSFAVLVALGKAAFGMVENLHHYNKLPIIIHVAAVLPTIPLGGWLLLAKKGTARHKQLGKVWLVLMLITATSAIFIQSSGGYSWIHLFVPITFHAAWKVVATARRGDIQAHKRHLVFTYLTALMLPGIAAFIIPGRLMNVMLLG
jgi:uncharacterized membrane protein